MRGREKKLLKAAIRAAYESLAELEPYAAGERPPPPGAYARALRAILESQIAMLETLADVPVSVSVSVPVPVPEPALAPAPAPAPSTLTHTALSIFALPDLNRWLASGTVFQLRGDLAFLNMNSMGGAKVDEMRGHLHKMGFSEDLGKLEAVGITGAVLLFKKP